MPRPRRQLAVRTHHVETVVLLEVDEFGFQVRAWRRADGVPRSKAEGEPIHLATFGDEADAVAEFLNVAAKAVEFVPPDPPKPRNLSKREQRQIDDAYRADLFDEVEGAPV